MDPVCGREGALPALVPSCVSHVRRPPINLLDYSKVLLDYCIVILVNKQFTYHHVITQITHFVSNIFCFIMKIPPPLHTLWPGLGGGCTHPSKSIPDIWWSYTIDANKMLYSKLQYTK
jgi:hypothetical protein